MALQRRAQGIPDLGPSPRDVCFQLRHHARNDDRDRLLEADDPENRVRGRERGGRRRSGRRSRSRGGCRRRRGRRGRSRRPRRYAQGCEQEQSETAFGDSGAGGHEKLLEVQFDFQFGSPRTSTPSAPAIIAPRARPMNSPCSTTPGIGDKIRLNCSGSAIEPSEQSRI